MNERRYSAPSGIPALIGIIVLLIADGAWFVYSIQNQTVWAIIVAILAAIVLLICLGGFFTVAPNEGKVLQFFGRYVGTVRDAGPRWANPFYSKRGVSLRVRNFESSKLKVNDSDGNPIEIAAVVVWQVVDTAEALFQVNDYEDFVHIQSESALRQMAQSYPYDSHDTGAVSLRSHGSEITDHLQKEIQERLASAGVKVIESRIRNELPASKNTLPRNPSESIIGNPICWLNSSSLLPPTCSTPKGCPNWLNMLSCGPSE